MIDIAIIDDEASQAMVDEITKLDDAFTALGERRHEFTEEEWLDECSALIQRACKLTADCIKKLLGS
jgi:uncharacterized Fe-S cluster-containing MiaB family protein